MEWDFRQGRGDPCFTGILVQEINLTDMCLVGDVKKIFKGTERGFVEGPHIYKINNMYYLICAEGGTDYNHAESVSRSNSLFGPYEIHPNKLLITAKDTNAYLQRAGHGALVDGGQDGWFFVHLCGRPINNKRCPLGRETALQNIIWENGWPYLLDKTTTPKDYYILDKKIEKIDYNEDCLYNPLSKDFELDFQTLRTPFDNYIIKTENSVTLTGLQSVNSMHKQNTLQRRVQHFNSSFSVKLKYQPKNFSHMAGIMLRYQEGDLYLFYKTYDEELGEVLRLFTENDYQVNYYNDIKIPCNCDVFLNIRVVENIVKFYYSFDGVKFNDLNVSLDFSLLSDEVVKCGGFTGVFYGIHACDLELNKHSATFEEINYKKL